MDVASFDDIADEFGARVARIAWCSAATVDRKRRPRQRILHPIYEREIGYIATGRHSFKEKHLAANPHVSLSYWDPQHQQVYYDATAEWLDGMADTRRIWELYKNTPPPLGYDPAMIWKDGVEDPEFGVLKLTPWRIELYGLGNMATLEPPKVWRRART
jgi:general stress protein 26